MAGLGPRQRGSRDKIPGPWVLGIGHLSKYKSVDYFYFFFFQRNFQSKKQGILAKRKVPKALVHISVIALKTSWVGEPNHIVPGGLPSSFRTPKSFQVKWACKKVGVLCSQTPPLVRRGSGCSATLLPVAFPVSRFYACCQDLRELAGFVLKATEKIT